MNWSLCTTSNFAKHSRFCWHIPDFFFFFKKIACQHHPSDQLSKCSGQNPRTKWSNKQCLWTVCKTASPFFKKIRATAYREINFFGGVYNERSGGTLRLCKPFKGIALRVSIFPPTPRIRGSFLLLLFFFLKKARLDGRKRQKKIFCIFATSSLPKCFTPLLQDLHSNLFARYFFVPC